MLSLWVHLQKPLNLCLREIFATLIVHLRELFREQINPKLAFITLRKVLMLWAEKLYFIKLTYSILKSTKVQMFRIGWKWTLRRAITMRKSRSLRVRLWPSWGTLGGAWMIRIWDRLLTELEELPIPLEMHRISILMIFNCTRKRATTVPAELKLRKLTEPVAKERSTWLPRKKPTTLLTLSTTSTKTVPKNTQSPTFATNTRSSNAAKKSTSTVKLTTASV